MVCILISCTFNCASEVPLCQKILCVHFLVSKKLKRDAKEPLTKKEKRAKRREAKDVHGVISKLMEMYEKLRRYVIKCATRTILTIVQKLKKCFLS